MSSIRSFMACTAAGVLLSVGGVALAAPAQAQAQAQPGVTQQSRAAAPAGDGDNDGNPPNCGLLGLGCVLHGLLGIL
ncbi:hypothetical protein [Streptomyces sp. NPDC006739]|uniref:hypothetical protein n=1 Tax=Streptomyces sp. NPDC006739 TaxID=3364763 RepID=UPI00367D2CCA